MGKPDLLYTIGHMRFAVRLAAIYTNNLKGFRDDQPFDCYKPEIQHFAAQAAQGDPTLKSKLFAAYLQNILGLVGHKTTVKELAWIRKVFKKAKE